MWYAHPHRTRDANERVGRWPPNPRRPPDMNERWQVGRWLPNPHRTQDANEREWRWLPNPRQTRDANERVAGSRPTLIEGDTQTRGGSNWNILIERHLQMRRMWLAHPSANAIREREVVVPLALAYPHRTRDSNERRMWLGHPHRTRHANERCCEQHLHAPPNARDEAVDAPSLPLGCLRGLCHPVHIALCPPSPSSPTRA